MAKKSPAADESDTPQRVEDGFPPLPDEEIAAYADRESLSLMDLIVITNGQIRPGKVGLFVATAQEISLPPLTDFDLATVVPRNIKEMSEDIEASRLRLPCTPDEFVEWAERSVLLIAGGHKSVKFDETGDVEVCPDFGLPVAFVNAVAARKNANTAPDDRSEPVPEVGSTKWRTQTAKAAAEARHRLITEKKRLLQKIWKTGKYSSRNICADEECAALGMSFHTARRALRNTPDPKRT